eukprot:gnl/Hemi2/2430_TR859_c0_g1_i1.p2 gnl/Hemi2/2430_TR859_c0_g1~~gnl/Hemi2/2430_TR859_c0_g1_i1.p2  ORF type:complete len:336 (-),score=92.58 gnl/Hemi2/2430_TR859_c0_g1_i1:136-1143(-)
MGADVKLKLFAAGKPTTPPSWDNPKRYDAPASMYTQAKIPLSMTARPLGPQSLWSEAGRMYRVCKEEMQAFFPHGMAGECNKVEKECWGTMPFLLRPTVIEILRRDLTFSFGQFFKHPSHIFGSPYVDTWEAPLNLLVELYAAHSEMLRQIPISNPQDYNINTKLQNLAELVDFAQNCADFRVIRLCRDIIEELKTQTIFPVMFAVDDYNHLYGSTVFKRVYDKIPYHLREVKAQELSIVRMVSNFESTPIARGLFVCSTSNRVPLKEGGMLDYKGLAPFTYSLPRFTVTEFNNMVRFYRSIGLMARRVNPQFLKHLYALTGGSGHDLHMYAQLL